MDKKTVKSKINGNEELVEIRWREVDLDDLRSRVSIKHGHVEFKGRDYPIPLSQLRTPADILYWVNVLVRKNWMTTSLLCTFIENICEHNNIDPFDLESMRGTQVAKQ